MSSDTDGSTEQRLASLRERVARGMDRREFIRTLVAAGYSLGLARFLGVDDFLAAADGEVPVVTALVRTDPDDPWSVDTRTRSVPASWYASVSKAFELNELLAESTITGYLGSAVVPGTYDDGGATITVEVSVEADAVREVLDRAVDGVSINVDTIRNLDGLEDDVKREPRRARDPASTLVPAGISCETDTSIATLGPALYEPGTNSRYFSTAHHAFDGVEDARGATVSLPFENGQRTKLGTVTESYPVADVVTIESTGPYRPSSTIEGDRRYDIQGQFTRYGLADLVARDEPLEKVGALTGQTSGEIQGIDAVSCLTGSVCRRGQLRWGDETDMADGDSGSVSFHADPVGDDGSVLIAGFNNARTWWPGQSYVWGIAAYQLTEQHGFHF
ncbi:hypothetical protein ACFQO4_13740 [Saliphagus sp. GCM10025334]